MFPVHIKESETGLPDDPLYYLVTGSGMFLVKNHPLFHSRTPVKEIPWLPPEEAQFEFRGPPLPKVLLARALALFMSAWERYRAESVAIVYFRLGSQEYEIVIPRQVVGGIHCVYEEPVSVGPDELRVGTIHSHGAADAFHSDRDHADENFQDGVHLVFGNLDTVPTLLCSAMVNGRRFPLDAGDLIEGLPVREDLNLWREWAEGQVSEKMKPLKKPIHFGT